MDGWVLPLPLGRFSEDPTPHGRAGFPGCHSHAECRAKPGSETSMAGSRPPHGCDWPLTSGSRMNRSCRARAGSKRPDLPALLAFLGHPGTCPERTNSSHPGLLLTHRTLSQAPDRDLAPRGASLCSAGGPAGADGLTLPLLHQSVDHPPSGARSGSLLAGLHPALPRDSPGCQQGMIWVSETTHSDV